MKAKILLISLLLFTIMINAQAPQGISYQGVARNATGAILATQPITLRMSIRDITATGTIVYRETHTFTTNSLGQFSINIGLGTPITGTLSNVNWDNGAKFLQVEMSINSGSTYIDMGTTQFMSVPFALNAGNSYWTKNGNDIYNLNSGNVGIGTSSPTAKLHVSGGDALINGLTLGRAGGSFDNNLALGYSSLINNTVGTQNVALGYSSLINNISGAQNVGIGYKALNNNASGWYNTAIGFSALYSNNSLNNTAIGFKAMYLNSTGNSSTAIGCEALYNNNRMEITALGYRALYSNTTGQVNTAIGTQALQSNTYGLENTATGYKALFNNTTGSTNTAYGSLSLFANTTGFINTAFGAKALTSNTDGGNNTAIGYSSLLNNTIGDYNTANGFESMKTNTTGSFNTCIGSNANVMFGNLNNAISFGYNSIVNASNKAFIGNTSTSSIGGQVSWTAYSDRRIKNNIQENIPGLEFINELKPVTFHYDVKKENELLGSKEDKEWEGKYDIEKIQFSGFIAQDVEEAANKIGYDFSGIDKSGNIMGLRYSEFVVPLVKAVQELSKKNDKLKKEIEEMKLIISKNQSIDKFETSINDFQTSLLGQNITNFNDDSTIIPFQIQKDCTAATLVISESENNNIITAIPIALDETFIVLDTGQLENKHYKYILFINEKQVDCKNLKLPK